MGQPVPGRSVGKATLQVAGGSAADPKPVKQKTRNGLPLRVEWSARPVELEGAFRTPVRADIDQTYDVYEGSLLARS